MIILGIVVLVLAIFAISIYNSLVGKKNQVTNAYSAIDVMLKKRFDLLPNLVEIVKKYTDYESGLLTRIVELRADALKPGLNNDEKLKIDKEVGANVRGLMINAEQYPDLKANQNFLNLQTNWTESEEQIAAARRNYNAAITDYNNAIMMFPGNVFAGMMHFESLTVLESSEEERKNISAKDLFNS